MTQESRLPQAVETPTPTTHRPNATIRGAFGVRVRTGLRAGNPLAGNPEFTQTNPAATPDPGVNGLA